MNSDLSRQFFSAALLHIHGPLSRMIKMVVLHYNALRRDLRLSESRKSKAKVRLVLHSLVLVAYGIDSLVLSRLGHFALE